MWKLKYVLAAAGEPPMTTFNTSNDNNDECCLVPKITPIPPTPIGPKQSFSIAGHTGLPKWLSIDERRCLRLAIVNALLHRTIIWKEPVYTLTQMKLTLVNKQLAIHGQDIRVDLLSTT
jgi:hypothetical protein